MLTAEWAGRKTDLGIVLLPGPDGEMCVSHLCLASKGKRVATRFARAKLTHLLSIEELPVPQWVGRTPTALGDHLLRAIAATGRTIPTATWQAARRALIELRPQAEDHLAVLGMLVDPAQHLSQHTAEILAEQKDATGLALQATGMQRDVIGQWLPVRVPDARPPDNQRIAPWLAGLRPGPIREDFMVIHDASRLPGWWPASGDQNVGIVEFTNRSGGQLTIMNVNRHPIEEVTGVDLLYYHHEARSFTMVQYKRLTADSGVYRPGTDRSLPRELERMRAVEQGFVGLPGLGGQPLAPDPVWDFRLHPGACWMKFCEPSGFTPNGKELIRGYYLPLGLYDRLAASPLTLGPRGGRVFRGGQKGRWLNNTMFAGLMGEGWVGSDATISERLGELVHQILEGRRSVVFAEASVGQPEQRALALS
jgi:hypothetical protein